MEIYTVEGEQINDSRELLDYLKGQAKIIRQKKRDYELEQLSKHVREFKKKFNDPVSHKLLEATLKTNVILMRGDYEEM